jgi:hypothetical protein
MCVGFPEWTAQFCVRKTTGKDSSEACAIACQNRAVYSVLPLIMMSRSKIAHFNWECIAPFTPCVLVSVYGGFCRQNTTVQETRTVIKPDSAEQILKTCVSSATMDTAMIRPKHRFQSLRDILNTFESVSLQSAVLNYLVCGCNVRLQCAGFVCLGNTSDWTLAFISCLKSELIWQSLPREFAGLVLIKSTEFSSILARDLKSSIVISIKIWYYISQTQQLFIIIIMWNVR